MALPCDRALDPPLLLAHLGSDVLCIGYPSEVSPIHRCTDDCKYHADRDSRNGGRIPSYRVDASGQRVERQRVLRLLLLTWFWIKILQWVPQTHPVVLQMYPNRC
jgi:hypothetical protein